MITFKNKVAVVTGASSGVGKAIALGLAAQGTTLCLVGRNLETLETVATSARATATQVLCYETDLALDKDIIKLKDCLQKDCGRVGLLIHSAGVISLGRVEATPVEDFDLQYRINVRAPYLLTQALLPMLRLSAGQIVFINSGVITNSRADVAQYAATKYGLKALADSLRDEVNAEGLRVLSVYLGRTASPMQVMVHEKEGKVYDPGWLIQPDNVAAVVINALSLPYSAEVTDISIRPMKKP